MKIAIMTRGRVGRQETLKWIPSKYWADTALVCPAGEDHPEARNRIRQIWVPPEVTNYSEKMQWIYDGHCFDDHKVVIMDDDLYFNEYDENRVLRVIKDPVRLLPMFELMDELLDKFALVGVHPRMMAQQAKAPYEVNSKIVCIQGINRNAIPKGLRLDQAPILSDVRLNCELLSRGIANARITTHFVDWLPSQASGGCDYRTAEMQRDATAAIARDFAPYAQQVIKRPKTAKWLGDERYDLRVSWKQLYRDRPKAALNLLDRGTLENSAEAEAGPTEAVE